MSTKSTAAILLISLALIAFLLLLYKGTDERGELTTGPVPRVGVEPTPPLSSMVAVRLTEGNGTGAANIADYVKALVEMYASGKLPAHIEFPLANSTGDEVRQITGLGHQVVIRWLDPITLDTSADAPRFGAKGDYLAYFGDGWDADWKDGVVGSPPQLSGSGDSGWIWSNHEYVSGIPPSPGSAPTGEHLILARFLRRMGILTNDVSSARWPQDALDTYVKYYKRQLGGSWLRVRKDGGGRWVVDRTATNLRYDATSRTLVRVTGYGVSALDHDDTGKPLPENVVSGTLANCSGAQTPWGTVISAEENAQGYYGDFEACWNRKRRFTPGMGCGPGANINLPTAPSRASHFGASSSPAERHNRDMYGFLVEIDPGIPPDTYYKSMRDGGDGTGHRKIGSMGRARWENAAIVTDKNFRLFPGKQVVIYGANDRPGGRIYKFVSTRPYTKGMSRAEVRALLDSGTLFVAHFEGLDNATGLILHATGEPPVPEYPGTGRWIELSVDSGDIAPNASALGSTRKTVGEALADINWNGIGGFPTQNDVLSALFTASSKIGVMELNRPEDVEWNPRDPSGRPMLYVAFTGNTAPAALDQDGVLIGHGSKQGPPPVRSDRTGSIFAVEEHDPQSPWESDTFNFYTVFIGKHGTGPFDAANPDNLAIDADGGLWFETDGNFSINGTADAIYYLDMDSLHRAGRTGVANPAYGLPFRVIAVPGGSEPTGQTFSSNMETLFFNVQHPGGWSARSVLPRPR